MINELDYKGRKQKQNKKEKQQKVFFEGTWINLHLSVHYFTICSF